MKTRNVRIVPPYPITYRFKVKAEFQGATLLQLMRTRFPFHGIKIWETKIRNGQVGVNGASAHPDHILCLQDEVYHHNPRVVEPAVPDEVRILEVAEDHLFVYKPAPMPVHPGGRFNKNSLTMILESMGYSDLRVVHRLDAVTSGIVLFARTKGFAREAMLAFSRAEVKKTYYARVCNVPADKEVRIEAPIRRKNGFVFESALGLTHAKEAQTRFEVVERGTEEAIVRCMPETGRTHQIRLHLKHWGYPIIDDPIYGHQGDNSSVTTQKTAISLLNAGLEIEKLGVRYNLDIPESWLDSTVYSLS